MHTHTHTHTHTLSLSLSVPSQILSDSPFYVSEEINATKAVCQQ